MLTGYRLVLPDSFAERGAKLYATTCADGQTLKPTRTMPAGVECHDDFAIVSRISGDIAA